MRLLVTDNDACVVRLPVNSRKDPWLTRRRPGGRRSTNMATDSGGLTGGSNTVFTRLLVPLDGTVEAAAALPAAATLARATGASITLLRVPTNTGQDPAEEAIGGLIVEDDVRVAAEELARGGLVVDWVVRTGPVAQSIIQAGQTSKADVIVMATHGRTGLGRAFAGSVSERVVSDSGRPVLLLKNGGKRLDHIGT